MNKVIYIQAFFGIV